MKCFIGFCLCLLCLSSAQAGYIPVINGGFEVDGTYIGWPTQYGIWSYDATLVVAAEQGITPYEGVRMVRFVNTCQFWGACSSEASSLFQIFPVEGTGYADDIASGTFFLVAEYFCNRIAGDAETDTRFELIINAYGGPSYPSHWNDNIIFADSAAVITDSDPDTWERITLTTGMLPPDTKYIGVHIFARENVVNDYVDPELDGHYADDVRLYFGSIGTEKSSWSSIKTWHDE